MILRIQEDNDEQHVAGTCKWTLPLQMVMDTRRHFGCSGLADDIGTSFWNSCGCVPNGWLQMEQARGSN